MSEVDRVSAAFLAPGQGLQPGGRDAPATATEIPSPSADAAAEEIARSGGWIQTSPVGGSLRTDQPARGIEPDPMAGPAGRQQGAHRDAAISGEDRRRFEATVRQARSAGQRGDGRECAQKLAEARTILREAGIGSTQRGTTIGSGNPGNPGGPPASTPGVAGPGSFGGSGGSMGSGSGGSAR